MRRIIRNPVLAVVALAAMMSALAADTASSQFKVIKKFALDGGGRWDYVTVDAVSRRVYMSRATHVTVLDADSGAVVGEIPETPGVHGIAVAPELGVGFTTNGGENRISVFDLKTLKVLSKIEAGAGPDSILFHPTTRTLFVQNGKGNSSSVIDATTKQVVATIPLGGKPEFAVYDDNGNVFINLEDKNAIVVLDAANKKVKATWLLAPCEGPGGLAIDRHSHTLFSACNNRLLAVVDSDSGTIRQTLPIGDDCDGTMFDSETGYVFTANGAGTVTIAHKDASGKYTVVQNLSTQPGSKTLGIDPVKHRIYLPAAKFPSDPTAHPRPNPVPGSITVLVIAE